MMTSDRQTVTGVVIDPGHGGKDFGVINGDVTEKDLNLEVSRYIYYRLNELGIPVSLTRDCDVDLSNEERVRRILDAFGDKESVIVLSNHMGDSGVGANVMYAFRNDSVLANQIMKNLGEAGQVKNSPYQRRLPGNSSEDYYFVHRLTGSTEPVLVEYGNMNNSVDLNRIKNELLTYGEAVVKAIANYAGVTYKPPERGSNIYSVRRGDSLYSIARRFNTPIDTLIKLNRLTSNILSVGQILLIPRKEGELPGEPTTLTEETYTVKSGDSLYTIANEFNVSVNDIVSLNNLKSNLLSLGQVLKIPSKTVPAVPPEPTTPIETVMHTVKQGDCLYSLAREYKTTVAAIIGANNLSSTILSVGQQLVIPITGTPTPTLPGPAVPPPIPAPPTTPTEPTVPAEQEKPAVPVKPTVPVEPAVPIETTVPTTTYTVKNGDSLYTIANRFGVTVNDIVRANNLKSNALSLGQQLMIPTSTTPTSYINYTVKKGDNLYTIADRFNTTVDKIKKASGITTNALSLGQVLRIPR